MNFKRAHNTGEHVRNFLIKKKKKKQDTHKQLDMKSKLIPRLYVLPFIIDLQETW